MQILRKFRFIFLLLLFLAANPLQACEKFKVVNEKTNVVFTNLQDAINAASSGDTLDIKGIFIGPFSVTKNLILKGRHKAVLDGACSTTVLTISTSAAAASPTTVVLENLTIQNGFTEAFGGAGILNIDGNVVLKDCKIINNTTLEGFGGGILNITVSGFVASLTIIDSKIFRNKSQFGGGIANNGGFLDIRNSKIAFNKSVLDGGGVHSLGGTNTLFNTKIIHNTASRNAGGFGNNVGSLTTLNKVKIIENKAVFGGGIFNGSTEIVSTIILINSKLYKNCAEEGGGLYNNTGATAALNDSKVKKNAAQVGGGILNNTGGILDLNDTKVTENKPDNIVNL